MGYDAARTIDLGRVQYTGVGGANTWAGGIQLSGNAFVGVDNGQAVQAIARAARSPKLPLSIQALMLNGMSRDFSWNASAKEYVRVYERVRQRPATAA